MEHTAHPASCSTPCSGHCLANASAGFGGLSSRVGYRHLVPVSTKLPHPSPSLLFSGYLFHVCCPAQTPSIHLIFPLPPLLPPSPDPPSPAPRPTSKPPQVQTQLTTPDPDHAPIPLPQTPPPLPSCLVHPNLEHPHLSRTAIRKILPLHRRRRGRAPQSDRFEFRLGPRSAYCAESGSGRYGVCGV